MRTHSMICRSPDGMSSSKVVHAYSEGEQLHDDHAVTTVIIQAGGGQQDHTHDDGLIHSHDWASAAR